jgi:hypothetical protein
MAPEGPKPGSIVGWQCALWLSTGLAITLLPKCALCVAGYVAVAIGLGMTPPELCGAGTDGTAWPFWAAGIATGAIFVGTGWLKKCAGKRPSAVARSSADRPDAA